MAKMKIDLIKAKMRNELIGYDKLYADEHGEINRTLLGESVGNELGLDEDYFTDGNSDLWQAAHEVAEEWEAKHSG